MIDIIVKIEKTVNVILPFAVFVLAALNLSGAIPAVETAANIIIAALAALSAVLKIWCITALKAQAEKQKGV